MASKGEFEITYFGGPDNPAPSGGVNYSVPYTSLPPNDLAPGTLNTQAINGFLCSSPWIANSPFTLNFNGTPLAGEHIIGTWEYTGSVSFVPVTGGVTNVSSVLIVTNVAVYAATAYGSQSTNPAPTSLNLLHLWTAGELNHAFLFPGQSVSFVQVGSYVYLTGLMLQGVFFYNIQAGWGIATNYVSGRFISELAGRLVVAECYFPGGGGTGAQVLPTIAWSGVGIYGQAWDGNAAHDVWNPLNQTFFNGNIGGFNLLGDVPDQITGLGLVGQSIIIIRTNGLTQQDPNSTYSNSGIQPYNWYHMWSSSKGVGGVVGSVSQFGQTLIFKSSDNVYSLSLSAGLSPIGNKIMGRMEADLVTISSAPGVYSAGGSGSVTLYINPWWLFSTIYELDGQLHYLLTLSTYFTNAAASPTSQFTSCFGYDYNLSENSWHVWDFSQYYISTGPGSGFVGFSCPPLMMNPTVFPLPNFGEVISTISNPRLLVAGVFTSYGLPTGSFPLNPGTLISLVSFDYDNTSNVYTGYLNQFYSPLALPGTTVVCRGEILSLGHKIATRRVRILSDNSPGASVTFPQIAEAQIRGEVSSQTSVPLVLDGNSPPSGSPIRTKYFDVVLADYTVQVSVFSVINPTVPWNNICCFRIASISLIGIDTTSTTQ